MSDCNVCLTGSDERCDVWDKKTVRAAKPHKCYECQKVIAAGDSYIRIKMLYEGEWETTHTCLVCSEIRETFYCYGEMCGELWNQLCDYVFPELTTACFDRLKTLAAKQELQRRWTDWKFA